MDEKIKELEKMFDEIKLIHEKNLSDLEAKVDLAIDKQRKLVGAINSIVRKFGYEIQL